jgi:hypothetical protein
MVKILPVSPFFFQQKAENFRCTWCGMILAYTLLARERTGHLGKSGHETDPSFTQSGEVGIDRL